MVMDDRNEAEKSKDLQKREAKLEVESRHARRTSSLHLFCPQ